MAKIHPSFEIISNLKVPPTEGELYLLKYLETHFDESADVYFQPFFNGDRPDIVIIHKTKGIIIVEVKDWHLEYYELDNKNRWLLKKDKTVLRSPFAQVFTYKKNIFDIHVNGFLDKKIENRYFYKLISCFVYFHYESKKSLNTFYSSELKNNAENQRENLNKFNVGKINLNCYEKNDRWLKEKQQQFNRDLYANTITKDQLTKLKFPYQTSCDLYPESVYLELLRYLEPPVHYKTQGKLIKYSTEQARCSESYAPRLSKIKGVAGAGKTLTLAKLAVNAHKRHQDKILILTYNLTLKNYVHDKISNVREDFNWGVFFINNYHQFITLALNTAGVELSPPETDNSKDIEDYFDSIYSNINLFDGFEISYKYKTILVDELQDYKPVWIQIIKKYFLAADGEMVLFGDSGQDIYDRNTSTKALSSFDRFENFGQWLTLPSYYRFTDYFLPRLANSFRSKFLNDTKEPESEQLLLIAGGHNRCISYLPQKLDELVHIIFDIAREYNIPPNDIVILSSKITQLLEIDYIIRHTEALNTKTTTTFETKEMISTSPPLSYRDKQIIRSNKKYHFWQNSGYMKISTIHSYKGLESSTVFLILNEYDSSALTYVGLTRAINNLFVFVCPNSPFESFFLEHLEDKAEFRK